MAQKHFLHLICFLWLIQPLAATPSLAKPGCSDTCGNVTIPYPFGIGDGCSIDEWFEVVCHENRSYLKKYYGQPLEVEVQDVSLSDLRMTVNSGNSNIQVCEDKSIRLAGNLSGSPFFYDLNKVILLGCGTVTLLQDGHILGACTSVCGQLRSSSTIRYDNCNGKDCCEISIPSTAQDFYLNFSLSVTRTNSCASVIFGNNPVVYVGSSYSYTYNDLFAVELRWSIPGLQNNSNCYANEYYGGYFCFCRGCTEGNPYLPNGCRDMLGNRRVLCYEGTSTSRKKLILLAVGGTIFGILFLVAAIVLSYKRIRRRRERKLKEKFFKRNGGLLLQQQMSVDQNIVEKVKLFTVLELGKATDNFNANRILGHGGQGTVYKGMLVDGKIVAVKKSILTDESQVEQFINEVVVLSQISHRNVVKLLGCCLETDVPLLVYEFIPNGTLYNLIHNESYDEFLMSWDMRLKIAIEIAGALAYLHSATSVPVYHRDIKSSNILLDEKYVAKLSDFGTSRHFTIDQTHLTTLVKGTFGYLDPEYFQSSQFTEKSDVYSFGVVLVELLTRQKPISSARIDDHESCLSLATRFLISMEEDSLKMILDTQILETASYEQVVAVAKLSRRCLSLDGKKRPTMKEVAMELENIKMFLHPSIVVETKFEGESSSAIELVVISDGTPSWTTTNDIITTSSDASPLLPNTF